MGDREPQRLGKYVLLHRLAFGGMAELFLANVEGAAGFHKRLVIKRILPQFSRDPQCVAMFCDEANIAAKLDHPNIVQVIDFGRDAETDAFYLCMEHVDGVDLDGVQCAIDAGAIDPLVPAQVAAIGEPLARGLAYAHDLRDTDDGHPLGIVHRDVSPHNVMLSRTGAVKLTDFGIAAARARLGHTEPGELKGKLAYMAPEVAAGASADARSDQFAVARVLWQLLVGRRDHDAVASDVALWLRLQRYEPPIHPAAAGDASPTRALAQVLLPALAADPSDRYVGLNELADSLAAFRVELGAAARVDLGALAAEAQAWAQRTSPVRERQTRTLPGQDSRGAAATASGSSGAATTRPAAPRRSRRLARRSASLTAALVVVVIAVPTSSLEGPAGVRQPVAPATVVASEDERGAPSPSLPVSPSPPPSSSSPVSPVSRASPVSRQTSRQPPPAPLANGLLSLRSAGPWLTVVEGDEILGTTPLAGIEITAGVHSLRLVNPLAGIDTTLSVAIEPGQHTRQTVDLAVALAPAGPAR